MAFAEILPVKSICPPAKDYSDAMFNLSDQFLPDGKWRWPAAHCQVSGLVATTHGGNTSWRRIPVYP